MKKTQNKDYVLPEAGTDINLLKNKSIFVDDFSEDELSNENNTIYQQIPDKKSSYPPFVYILSDIINTRAPYTKYNTPEGRQLLNNNQYMIIKRLFKLYNNELYSNTNIADAILLSLAHLPNDIRGIATYRILQGVLPEMPFRKSPVTRNNTHDDGYDNRLIKCVSRYYEISKHEAELYIDMLYKINKQSQLNDLLVMYGYDDKLIKQILKK